MSRRNFLLLAFALVFAIAGLGMAPRRPHKIHFPRDFSWGAATAAMQVEGYNTNNDWYLWGQEGHTAQPAGVADEEFFLYDQDYAMAQSLGHNAHRLSLEWSRIEPRQGVFDPLAIQHYRDVLLAARAHGLKTFVTLQHHALPIWVANQGSWLANDIPTWYAEYVAEVVATLGDLVDYWLTINEPNVNAITGYVAGASPPGLTNTANLQPVITHMLKSHAAAYHLIHSVYPNAMVSFAHHMRVFRGAHWWNPLDALIAGFIDDIWNNQILRAMRTGTIRLYAPFLINYTEEWPALRDTLDFIGVNYYTRNTVQFDLSSPEKFDILDGQAPNQFEVYPEGLYQMLMRASSFGHLPIFITENGIDDGADAKRPKFLCDHLREVAYAMEDGADVRGYLHWALIDNWEWVYGFGPKFGLVAIDYSTQSRTPRGSAYLLAQIARSGSLEACGNQ